MSHKRHERKVTPPKEGSQTFHIKIGDTELWETPRVRLLAEWQPKAIEWLWKDRIPLGKLTVIEGPPGVGKSMMVLDLVARLTRDAPWPDGPKSRVAGAGLNPGVAGAGPAGSPGGPYGSSPSGASQASVGW